MDNYVFSSSNEVWDFIVANGGLDIKRYDYDFINEIKTKLGLPQVGDMNTYLSIYDIGIEELIVSFFSCLQPFSEMMTDLFSVFENANVKESNNNFTVSFDFSKKIEKLTFSLENFKKWMKVSKKIYRYYWHFDLDTNQLWGINNLFRNNDYFYDKEINNSELSEWLNTYNHGMWPDKNINYPKTGNLHIDLKISQIWSIWEGIVLKSRSYNTSRDAIRQYIWQNKNRDLNILAMIDSDKWAGSFAYGLYSRVNDILLSNSEQRVILLQKLDNDLCSALDITDLKPYQKEEMIEELIEYLSLPIWKHRYELYAAWIFSQIVNAVDENRIKIICTDGKIEFSFSGSHLANIEGKNGKLQVWTELRTKMSNPVGKGRKNGIQPDYSIVTFPHSDPESSIVVIECKQYLKPSTSNFSKAIQDYTKGRINAKVILVNYGPTNEKNILKKIDSLLARRVHIIGDMKPGNEKSLETFKSEIASSINEYMMNKHSLLSDFDKEMIIRLTWNDKPRDLDIHLKVTDLYNKEIFDINYMNTKHGNDGVDCSLREDCTNGKGPEIIQIHKWEEGLYHIRVHNYSQEERLAGCGAQLEIIWGPHTIKYTCPDIGDGNWWNVVSVNTLAGYIQEINILE